MTRRLALALALLFPALHPAAAADSRATFVTNLFINACVPNLGQPAKVREWAEQQHLGEIHDPVPLGLFVGPGDQGAAWAVPDAVGLFALSIRGRTQGCAVWAREADPVDALAYFKQLMEGVKRPGLEITVLTDTVTATPNGGAHTLVYNIGRPGYPSSFVFTLLTAERPGGAFQVSMQVAKATTQREPAQ